jgi:hypothetical protein
MPFLNDSQKNAAKLFTLGIQVSKAAAVLPATTTQDIFTVVGGRVFVTCLVGEVTTVCSGTATNLKMTSTPSVGSAVDIAANLAIASFEAGAILVVEGDGTAIIGTATGAGFAPALNALPFILPAGTINIETSATNTGAMKWDLFYFPLDDGAYVTSA